MGYNEDREFTDYIHDNLAIPLIYSPLNWKVQKISSQRLTENADIFTAIDAFLINITKERIITVQERFRECKYVKYNDFTIRYKRDFNKHEERKLSEFFKLDADYFVYGIVDTYKYQKEKATKFLKYAVIDIKILKSLFDTNQIIIDESIKGLFCVLKNNKIYCPVNFNRDNSSSFIPIDIRLLKKLFGNSGVILQSEGF